jgi:hypothetical protein
MNARRLRHSRLVRIDGLGSPGLPPAVLPGGTGPQPQTVNNSAMLLAIEEAEKKGGGGGGGGGGHAHDAKKSTLSSIDEIAARASLNIETRKKTVADRMKEIEQLKAEMAEADDAGDDAAADEDGEPPRDPSSGETFA